MHMPPVRSERGKSRSHTTWQAFKLGWAPCSLFTVPLGERIRGGAALRLGAPAVLAAVVLEAHGHVSSLIPVRAAVLAATLRERALLGELPPIVSVRAEQNGVRKRPWPGASCGGCLNEGTWGPMGRKSGHGVVFMTHHRR